MFLEDTKEEEMVRFEKEVIGGITVPANKLLLAGTVAANNLLLAGNPQDPSMILPGPF